MYKLTPALIAEITGGKYVGGDEQKKIAVAGAVRDNRDVRAGNLFVCIPGERTDGHLYANAAFEAGAACCLAEREIPDAKGAYVLVDSTLEAIKKLGGYHRRQFNVPVIGITGSVGKTTAKELIAAALGSKLRVLKTEKNLNNELGVPLTLMSLSGEHEAAVVEMGISGFGEMSRLAEMVRPDIFVMTSIGYSHTNELGDLHGVLRAKTEAFAYMNADGIAVMNGDDELLRGFVPKTRKTKAGESEGEAQLRRITFGQGVGNDFRATNIKNIGTDAVEMDIAYDGGRCHVRLSAYGSHLAVLAPAAAAVGRLLGLSGDEIARGLSEYCHVEGRSNISVIGGITVVDDCYNANPSSVKAALVSLSQLPATRRVAILGDMLNLGEHSEHLHREVGAEAARRGFDMLLCCGDEARIIAEGYESEGGAAPRYYSEIEQLKSDLPKHLKKGDAVLVKASRSMRFERLLQIIRNQFD